MKVCLLLTFLTFNAGAAYHYPDKVFEKQDDELKEILFKEASKNYKSQSYKAARKAIFNKLYLEQDGQGYFVRDVYCDVIKRAGVSTTSLPHHEILNTEHVWPQMYFSFPYSNIQKTDLHHLMPVGHKANSYRGNLPFGETGEEEGLFPGCFASNRGISEFDPKKKFFQPPAAIRGNVARAMFYFSVRYKERISEIQEFYLRLWHLDDPVDEQEIYRHNKIYQIQKNRNPFIDHPELVESISDY